MNNKQKQLCWVGAAVITGGAIAYVTTRRSKPLKARPLFNFDINRYLGKWYEIARMDFRHERNLSNTTAEYSLNKDGNVRVLNKGYNFKKHEWQIAEGVAKFRNDPNVAALKVSFFGPFYSGYNVVAIDENYQYALVVGESLKYMWILSRQSNMPDRVRNEYLAVAESIGYDTSKLTWVDQH